MYDHFARFYHETSIIGSGPIETSAKLSRTTACQLFHILPSNVGGRYPNQTELFWLDLRKTWPTFEVITWFYKLSSKAVDLMSVPQKITCTKKILQINLQHSCDISIVAKTCCGADMYFINTRTIYIC